jgi:hypothetical protein
MDSVSSTMILISSASRRFSSRGSCHHLGLRVTQSKCPRKGKPPQVTGWRPHQPITGKPDFVIQKGTSGGVRGWLFLARVPELLRQAEAECRILAREDRRQSKAGPQGLPPTPRRRLERVPRMGVQTQKAGYRDGQDSTNAGTRLTTDQPNAQIPPSGMNPALEPVAGASSTRRPRVPRLARSTWNVRVRLPEFN